LGLQICKQVLPLGDILIQTTEGKDVLLIERKSFSDLLASIRDGRYDEQSYRLMHSGGFQLHNIIYLLEGMFSQTREKEKKLIYSSMTSLHYFKGFSVIRTASLRETAEWVVWTADKIDRDFLKGKIPSYLMRPAVCVNKKVKEEEITTETKTLGEEPTDGKPADVEPTNEESTEGKPTNEEPAAEEPAAEEPTDNNNIYFTENIPAYSTVVKKIKKDNITPHNIGEILLCQIPSVHSVTAIAIMKKFSSFQNLMKSLENQPNCLDDIYTETKGKKRKISKAVIENIKKYLLVPST